MINNLNLKHNKGYTLLFAVIVSAVVLTVGISILNISKKEFLLSVASRDSIIAFNAADSGFECALFNDVSFATTSTAGFSINCIGQSITMFPVFPNDDGGNNDGTGLFTFDLKVGSNTNSCARVIVLKYYQIDSKFGDAYLPYTRIESRGYNTGWDQGNNTCSKAGPNRVERAIRYTF